MLTCSANPIVPMNYELLIGLRYTRAQPREGVANRFISFIALISMAGLALGLAVTAAQADITVGVTISTTGPAASLGIPEKNTINIGGMTAHTGAANRAHVVTAKAALGGLTRALAHELAGFGITVNCVSPGLIDTVRQASSASARPAHHGQHKSLITRRGQPDEVASAVVWLAGPGARFTTGQTLHVNGGAYLGG